jgi:hypothetical protein
MCTDDGREDDDTIAMASMPGDTVSDGQICAGDTDYFRIDGAFRELVTVTVDGFSHSEGDLDLRLLDSAGTILASSAGTMDSESAQHCMGDGGRVYAQVLGYRMAEGGYSLRVTRMAGACCADDAGEPDDSASSARRIEGTAFDGTVCPEDDDYIAVPILGASRVEITLVFDGGIGDVDLELYAPGSSTPLARSTGTGDMESISATVTTAGTYAIRVYGYSMAANTYLGEVTVTPTATCTLSRECPAGQVCASGSCRSDDCTAMAMCPPMHLCPDVGPGTATSDCGAICTVNTDCRTTEACKWFPEGRACGTRGTGLNGDACASFRECGGQRACVDWPGGYCARAGCRTNADCETGTWCVAVGGQNVCTLDCLLSDDICRLDEGYACDFVADVSGSSHFACVPE